MPEARTLVPAVLFLAGAVLLAGCGKKPQEEARVDTPPQVQPPQAQPPQPKESPTPKPKDIPVPKKETRPVVTPLPVAPLREIVSDTVITPSDLKLGRNPLSIQPKVKITIEGVTLANVKYAAHYQGIVTEGPPPPSLIEFQLAPQLYVNLYQKDGKVTIETRRNPKAIELELVRRMGVKGEESILIDPGAVTDLNPPVKLPPGEPVVTTNKSLSLRLSEMGPITHLKVSKQTSVTILGVDTKNSVMKGFSKNGKSPETLKIPEKVNTVTTFMPESSPATQAGVRRAADDALAVHSWGPDPVEYTITKIADGTAVEITPAKGVKFDPPAPKKTEPEPKVEAGAKGEVELKSSTTLSADKLKVGSNLYLVNRDVTVTVTDIDVKGSKVARHFAGDIVPVDIPSGKKDFWIKVAEPYQNTSFKAGEAPGSISIWTDRVCHKPVAMNIQKRVTPDGKPVVTIDLGEVTDPAPLLKPAKGAPAVLKSSRAIRLDDLGERTVVELGKAEVFVALVGANPSKSTYFSPTTVKAAPGVNPDGSLPVPTTPGDSASVCLTKSGGPWIRVQCDQYAPTMNVANAGLNDGGAPVKFLVVKKPGTEGAVSIEPFVEPKGNR